METPKTWVYDFYYAVFAGCKACSEQEIETLFIRGKRMSMPQIVHRWATETCWLRILPYDDGLWCALVDVIMGHLMSMAMRRCRRLRCSVSLASKFPKLYTAEWWFE